MTPQRINGAVGQDAALTELGLLLSAVAAFAAAIHTAVGLSGTPVRTLPFVGTGC